MRERVKGSMKRTRDIDYVIQMNCVINENSGTTRSTNEGLYGRQPDQNAIKKEQKGRNLPCLEVYKLIRKFKTRTEKRK